MSHGDDMVKEVTGYIVDQWQDQKRKLSDVRRVLDGHDIDVELKHLATGLNEWRAIALRYCDALNRIKRASTDDCARAIASDALSPKDMSTSTAEETEKY